MHHTFDVIRAALLLERRIDARRLTDHFDMLDIGRGVCRAQPFTDQRHGQRRERETEDCAGAAARMTAALVHECPSPKSPLTPGKWPGKWEGKLGTGRDGSVTAPGDKPFKPPVCRESGVGMS
ncbi:hypothetical protein D9M71_644850 [compost metagenome]